MMDITGEHADQVSQVVRIMSLEQRNSHFVDLSAAGDDMKWVLSVFLVLPFF